MRRNSVTVIKTCPMHYWTHGPERPAKKQTLQRNLSRTQPVTSTPILSDPIPFYQNKLHGCDIIPVYAITKHFDNFTQRPRLTWCPTRQHSNLDIIFRLEATLDIVV